MTAAPRVRPGWVELQEGHWLRAAAVTVEADGGLPEPEPDGIHIQTAVWAGGREWQSVFTTAAVLDAIAEAERSGAGR